MKLLLDTHVLLWAAGEPSNFSEENYAMLSDRDNDLLFSVASIWEVVIKSSLGRNDFRVDAHLLRRGLLDNGYTELPITAEHALAVKNLPPIHKDPFDRILVAQALSEGVLLLTADVLISRYPAPIKLVQ